MHAAIMWQPCLLAVRGLVHSQQLVHQPGVGSACCGAAGGTGAGTSLPDGAAAAAAAHERLGSAEQCAGGAPVASALAGGLSASAGVRSATNVLLGHAHEPAGPAAACGGSAFAFILLSWRMGAHLALHKALGGAHPAAACVSVSGGLLVAGRRLGAGGAGSRALLLTASQPLLCQILRLLHSGEGGHSGIRE